MGWQDDPTVIPAPQATPDAPPMALGGPGAPPGRSWRDDPSVAPDLASYTHQQALEDERISKEGPWNPGGFARSVAQGATFGFGDEAEAGVKSLLPGYSYNDELARIRQGNEDFARRNPGAALVGEGTGALVTAALAPELRAAEALGYAGRGAAPARGLLNQSIRSGATGATYGGLYGFGSGEGGFANRAENAVSGAELGGGIGLGVPLALRAANIATGPIRNIGGAINSRTMGTVAEDAVIQALQRDGYTPEQALQIYRQHQADTRLGSNSYATLPEAIADLGPNTQRLAQTITAEPGAAQRIGTEFLEGRAGVDRENLTPQTSQQARINDAYRRANRVSTQPDYNTAVNNVVDEQQRLSAPAYATVRAHPTVFDVGPILEQQRLQNADLVGPTRQKFDQAVGLFQEPMQTRIAPMTEAVQDRALANVARRALPGTAERGIVEGLQSDLATGQFPAASMQRQQRFQQALNDIDNLMQNAAPKSYARLNAVRSNLERTSNLAGKTQNIPWSSTQTRLGRFDAAKQALDDMISSARRAGENNQERILTSLKNDLVEHADLSTAATAGDRTSSPYYRARGIYSSRAELLDAAEQGRALMRGNSTITARDFNAMTPAEQRMFRQGTAEEVRSMLGDKAYGEDTTRLFKKPNVQEVMQLAFPHNTPAFQPRAQFNRLVAREANMQKTFQMGTKGSDTARIEAGKEDFKNLSVFGRAIRTVGPEGAIWVTVTEGLQHLTRMREADAARVARLLFNSNPATVERTLTMLQQRYGSNVAYRMRRLIEPRMRAVPGATGAVAALEQNRAE